MNSPSGKKKIIYVITSLLLGGAEKVTEGLISALDPQEWKVGLVALDEPDGLHEHNDLLLMNYPDHVKYHCIPSDVPISYSLKSYLELAYKGKKYASGVSSIIEYLHSEKPDIIHFHIHPRFLLIAQLLSKKTNAQLLFTDHSVRIDPNQRTINKKLFGIALRKLYKPCHQIYVSKAVQEVAEKYHLGNKKKLSRTIINGIDTKYFTPQRSENAAVINPKNSNDIVRVVYVARITKGKGFEDLIDAWSKIYKDVNAQLILAGDDELGGNIHRMAKEKVEDHSILFKGAVSDIKGLLNECNMAVFPSHREGLPLALLEMMSMELPVVCSDIPELTSIVTDNETGILFNCKNSGHLAEKLKYLISSPKEQVRIGQNARKLIEKKYNLAHNIHQNLEIYNQLINL